MNTYRMVIISLLLVISVICAHSLPSNLLTLPDDSVVLDCDVQAIMKGVTEAPTFAATQVQSHAQWLGNLGSAITMTAVVKGALVRNYREVR